LFAVMIDNFKNDSQLRLLVILGATTALAVSAFALYRALHAEWVAASVDLGIAVLVCAPALHALRSGRTRGAGVAMCVINSLACAAASWLIGPVAAQWLYLVLMSNFFITSPGVALVSNTALTVAILTMNLYETNLETAAVAVTAALSTLFAYLFAVRVRDDQRRLESMASLDALTGLPNRRSMERALAAAIAKHADDDTRYGLVMLDLDNFKEVNDTFGHAAGDAALADLATILKFEMRRNDMVFRFGGEEFVVLLEIKDSDELVAIAERLRLAVHKNLRGPGGRITISLGAAVLGVEENWQEWFSLADTALYAAKGKGRDNSVVYAAGT